MRNPLRRARGRADTWRMQMGATPDGTGTTFRVWAPDARTLDVDIDGQTTPLVRGAGGIWSTRIEGSGAGSRYAFRVDGGAAFSDPYSRSQPDGPHGASEVVDPEAHPWRDTGWHGLRLRGLVIYECHVGIHTHEGTFDALAGDLDALRDLGINAIELMPVGDFPGARNWGYDGVNLFAPSRNYGGAAALKRLVDAAHARGIGVILDVVYNHFGPDGNYLLQYSKDYLTGRHTTPWGDAVNFDGRHAAHVRRYVVDNARYWINEYHIDGLRLDATFAIVDESPRHILAELTAAARACTDREIVLIAESNENDVRYVRPERDGGFGFDAVWADDFHHSVHTATSHEHSGYYRDYDGTTAELSRTINRAWNFEGQVSAHTGAPRGTPADGVAAEHFVYFIQNHDQVGNRAFGRRLTHLVGADAPKPWVALLLLLPYTPMLFAGQEFAASSRFHYFTDHNEELGRAITEGRRREFAELFPDADVTDLPDPQAEATFLASKLNLQERHEGVGEHRFALHRELLRLRREDPVLRAQDRTRMRAIPATPALLLVHLWTGREQRLIALNTGTALDANPASCGVPGELTAMTWQAVISTEERRFGGTDDAVRFDASLISVPPQCAVLFSARASSAFDRIRAAVRRRAR